MWTATLDFKGQKQRRQTGQTGHSIDDKDIDTWANRQTRPNVGAT